MKQNQDELNSDKTKDIVLHTVGGIAVGLIARETGTEHGYPVLLALSTIWIVKDYLDPEITGQKHDR